MAINPNCPHFSDFGVTIFARKTKRRKFHGKQGLNKKNWLKWRMRYSD